MKTPTLVFALLSSVALIVGTSSAASAQERYQSPYGPTLSPYLDYFRAPTGVYDNYNTFVRPRQMLNQRLAQQDAGMQQTARQVGQIQLQMRGASTSLTRQAPIAPTGGVPGFLNYSHYYSSSARAR